MRFFLKSFHFIKPKPLDPQFYDHEFCIPT
nr:MAG TPA: hypothetical protein [Caudoviricetes sp.]